MLGLIVAVAADSPEITSAITASAQGQKDIGVGVVLGSNVFNLGALLGLGAIAAGRIKLHRRVVLLEGTTAMWVALVCAVVVPAGLGAGLGLALVLVVVVPYLVVSAAPPPALRRLGLPPKALSWLGGAVAEEESELSGVAHSAPRRRGDIPKALASLVVVIIASAFMEQSVHALGDHFHISDLVVGGVVLAGVTSLPNAVGALYLATRGRGAALLSEAMNSNMLNVLVGLFLPSVFIGLARPSGEGTLVAVWYAGLTLASLAIAFAGRGLRRSTGLAIVVGYVGFAVVAVIS
jgi:cation:H+ antiporter